jgi:hypothetical protein
MRTIARVLKGGAAAALTAALAVTLSPQPAQGSIAIIGTVTREEAPYEARFPDIVKLDDGRLMAVWHRATEHAGTASSPAPGSVQLSYWDGTAWSTPAAALANPGPWAGVDMRDPKLGKMNDGQVILTFFSSGKVYYSYWRPGWTRFTDPQQLTVAGAPSSIASHGGVLHLRDNGNGRNEALIPVYAGGAGGGAYYMRATYQPNSAQRLVPTFVKRIIANDNPAGRRYSEPSFVQIGNTIVAGIRSEQILEDPPANQTGQHARPLVIARWDAYNDAVNPTFELFRINGTDVLASSHHLLKTVKNGQEKIFFTYGNRSTYSQRPTYGVLIDNPLGTWTGTPRLLYDSGAYDQANPSSVEPADGWYWTLGFNANPNSADNGRLLIVRSQVGDF